jgi:hypothetical protein
MLAVGKFVGGQKLQGDDKFTLYSDGFTAKKLLNVIEQQKVWQLNRHSNLT